MERWLLRCECGVISTGEDAARCNRDRRFGIGADCPVVWEFWRRTSLPADRRPPPASSGPSPASSEGPDRQATA